MHGLPALRLMILFAKFADGTHGIDRLLCVLE